MIGVLTIHLILPGCKSLKEKRSRLKPLLARMQREFNISVAEMDLQDKWTDSIIACAMIGNDGAHLQRSLDTIRKWILSNWRNEQIFDDRIEIIS
jgi:uncharacterized protein YlxP (DUF503 family)